jgi:hypothetical protein
MHLIDNDVLMLISGGTIWNGNRIESVTPQLKLGA